MAGTRHAHNRFALHIQRKQFVDIPNGENVRVDNDCATLIAHRLRRHEAERREGLQIVIFPDAMFSATEKGLSFSRLKKGKVFVVEDAHVEAVRMPRIATERVSGHQRADQLFVIGVDEDRGFHCDSPSLESWRCSTLTQRRVRLQWASREVLSCCTDTRMGTMQRFLRRMLGDEIQASPALWPRTRKQPRVLYEIDREFHQLYERGLRITRMRDVAMRRQRYASFPSLLDNVRSVPGDVCEVGCYRGLSAYVIASILRKMEKSAPFHLCDSFEGLSEFSTVDRSRFHDMDRPEKRQKYVCSLEAVRQNLHEFDFIEYHKGWIPEPFRELSDHQFCFVHIDVDLYEPTRESFAFFYPRLSPRGVMVFDDYGSVKFPGARQAIDECLSWLPDVFFVPFPSGQAFLVKLENAAETKP